MVARLGNVVYWAATALAVLLVSIAGLELVIGAGPDRVYIAPSAAAAGVVVWLVGRATLYVLAGR